MKKHLCPYWAGYLQLIPLRKMYQNPVKILSPYITQGMTVADIGCAMGFFSLPASKLVGDSGHVVCIDIQEQMINTLNKRIKKHRLSDKITTRLSSIGSLNIQHMNDQIDFAFSIYAVHEVPDLVHFSADIYDALKPDGKLLILEPRGHVPQNLFEENIKVAELQGFNVLHQDKSLLNYSVVLIKK